MRSRSWERENVDMAEGFVARGSADEVVPAIQDHAFKAHNMKATREQVLARAERV